MQTSEPVETPIDISEDRETQSWEWEIQKRAWLILFLLFLASAMGLFGPSWLTRREIDSSENSMIFHQVVRATAPMDLEFSLKSNGQPTVEIWLNSQFLQGAQLERVSPLPLTSRLTSHGTTFVFAAEPSPSPVQVIFLFRPKSAGILRGQLRMQAQPVKNFSQWILP